MSNTELAKEFLELWAKKRHHMLSPAESERFQELERLLGTHRPSDLPEPSVDPPEGSEE